MKKNLTSRFAVQYTDGRAEQSRAEQSRAEQSRASKTLPFCAVQKRYQNAFKSWVAMSRKRFFIYIDAVKADKTRRKSYEKTIVIGNIVILHAVDNGADGRICGRG